MATPDGYPSLHDALFKMFRNGTTTFSTMTGLAGSTMFDSIRHQQQANADLGPMAYWQAHNPKPKPSFRLELDSVKLARSPIAGRYATAMVKRMQDKAFHDPRVEFRDLGKKAVLDDHGARYIADVYELQIVGEPGDA